MTHHTPVCTPEPPRGRQRAAGPLRLTRARAVLGALCAGRARGAARARPPRPFGSLRAGRKGGSAAAEGRDGGRTRRRSANRDALGGESDPSRPITKRERQPRPARRGAERRAGHGLQTTNHSLSGGGREAETPMEAASANCEGARELTVQRQPIGSRRCLGPAPPRVGLAPPQGSPAPRGAARGSRGPGSQARTKRRGRERSCCSASWRSCCPRPCCGSSCSWRSSARPVPCPPRSSAAAAGAPHCPSAPT